MKTATANASTLTNCRVRLAEPDWPEADVIIGNPPFLGGKRLRRELGDAYVDRLFAVWRDRVRPEADLCCYWFEKARAQIERGQCRRAGLLATPMPFTDGWATIPDGPGLGVEIDEAYLAHHAVAHTVIDAAGARPA